MGALLSTLLVVSILSSLEDAPTYDEPLYMVSGYYYLESGEFLLNLEHPPLAKAIAATPLLFMDVRRPGVKPMDTGYQFDFSHRFLYAINHRPQGMLQVSRMAMTLLLLITALLLYWWARSMFGWREALLALFFLLFSPVMVGYGRLATLDLAAALGVLAALAAYYNYLRWPSGKRLLAASVLFGLAQLVKFTCLILIPIIFLIVLVEAFRSPRGSRIIWLRKEMAGALLMMLVGFLMVALIYGMLVNTMDPAFREELIRVSFPDDQAWVSRLLSLHRISPPLAWYLAGMVKTARYLNQNWITYFHGNFYEGGVWFFFPVSFALKNPLAFLLLLLIGMIFFFRGPLRREEVFLLVPLVLIAISSFLVRAQLGIRYLLPLFPPLFLAVSRGLIHFLRGESWKRTRYFLVATLLFYIIFSFAWAFPHYISYMNEITGGPAERSRYLVDADLDWGQDLKRLAQYFEEREAVRPAVHYFGGGEVSYYIPDAIYWDYDYGRPKGWFAVSATIKEYSYLRERKGQPSYRWLEDYQPEKVIGSSIYVYYFP